MKRSVLSGWWKTRYAPASLASMGWWREMERATFSWMTYLLILKGRVWWTVRWGSGETWKRICFLTWMRLKEVKGGVMCLCFVWRSELSNCFRALKFSPDNLLLVWQLAWTTWGESCPTGAWLYLDSGNRVTYRLKNDPHQDIFKRDFGWGFSKMAWKYTGKNDMICSLPVHLCVCSDSKNATKSNSCLQMWTTEYQWESPFPKLEWVFSHADLLSRGVLSFAQYWLCCSLLSHLHDAIILFSRFSLSLASLFSLCMIEKKNSKMLSKHDK